MRAKQVFFPFVPLAPIVPPRRPRQRGSWQFSVGVQRGSLRPGSGATRAPPVISPKGVGEASFGGTLLGGGARGLGGGHTRGGWRLLMEATSWKERVQVQRSIRRQPSYAEGGGNRSILGIGQRIRVRVLTPFHIRGQFGRTRVLILLRILALKRKWAFRDFHNILNK